VRFTHEAMVWNAVLLFSLQAQVKRRHRGQIQAESLKLPRGDARVQAWGRRAAVDPGTRPRQTVLPASLSLHQGILVAGIYATCQSYTLKLRIYT
jgi:hypothetical protein